MQANQLRPSARLSKNGKYLIVDNGEQNVILNANLVRYLLDVPYTRKDGTRVSVEQIFEMKQKAQEAYESKIRTSAG